MPLKPKTHLHPLTPILILKLTLIPLLLLSTTILGLKLAIPYLISILPHVSTSLGTYLAPPYLFFTVNFIILTIWKLSDNGHAPNPRRPTSRPKSTTPESHHPTPRTHVEPSHELPMDDEWRSIGGVRRSETFRERVTVVRSPEMRRSETFSDKRRRVTGDEVVMNVDDELNRRVEAFIKKVNEQMRVNAQEPLLHDYRLEM